MAFDDLANDDSDEAADPGDEAMDELAATMSGATNPEQDESAEVDTDSDTGYDPETEPAFPTVKERTQHSIYCLPATWDAVDGASGMLFETEVLLRRDGYGAVQKRELHNAFLQAAINELSTENIAQAFIATRQEREDGPLLEES
jgi:hypothetical protein